MKDKENSITYLMNYLGKSFHKRASQMLEEEDIASTMFFYLIFIMKNPGVPMNELAKEFDIDKSYITRVVSNLEKKSLVQKITAKNDGRMQLLYITDKGKEIILRMDSYFEIHENHIKNTLEQKDYDILKNLLKKIYFVEKESHAHSGSGNNICPQYKD